MKINVNNELWIKKRHLQGSIWHGAGSKGGGLTATIVKSHRRQDMAINFAGVETAIADAKTEAVQVDEAQAALDTAKTQLAEAQSTVATKQAEVTAASETLSTEKADVVAKVQVALNGLQAILNELQA